MNEFGEKLGQADIVESESKKATGLELAKSQELDEAVTQADQLAHDLENDRNVKVEQLLGLDEAMGKVKVNFGAEGETVTLEELKQIPDVEKNVKIYEKIKRAVEQNKANGIDEVTYLTPEIARKLVAVFRMGQSMSFLSLKVMTDEVAEILGQGNGIDIRMPGLKNLTGRQLRRLLVKTGTISLSGLDIESVNRDLAITLAQCGGRIYMNDDQLDRLKSLFPEFKFRREY